MNNKYEIGTMLFRRKKATCRCGDFFIVVEKKKFGSKLLSVRKDGHINVSWVEDDTLEKLYVNVGHTHAIEEWVYLAKRGLA